MLVESIRAATHEPPMRFKTDVTEARQCVLDLAIAEVKRRAEQGETSAVLTHTRSDRFDYTVRLNRTPTLDITQITFGQKSVLLEQIIDHITTLVKDKVESKFKPYLYFSLLFDLETAINVSWSHAFQ